MTDKPHGLKGRPSNRLGTGTAEPSATITIRLPVRVIDALKAKADDHGQSLSRYVCGLLKPHWLYLSEPAD